MYDIQPGTPCCEVCEKPTNMLVANDGKLVCPSCNEASPSPIKIEWGEF